MPAPFNVGETIEGILEKGDFSFFQFQLPTIGMSLLLEGETGQTVLFASNKIHNPTSAFYDSRYNSLEDKGGLYISPDTFLRGNTSGWSWRTAAGDKMASSNGSNITVFVTIEGLEDRNAFTLHTVSGRPCEW